jgi:protein-arginine kinase activator protein McsA
MSVVQKLKSAIPVEFEDGATERTWECHECGNVFDSYKRPERVKCMDCLSTDVTEVE